MSTPAATPSWATMAHTHPGTSAMSPATPCPPPATPCPPGSTISTSAPWRAASRAVASAAWSPRSSAALVSHSAPPTLTTWPWPVGVAISHEPPGTGKQPVAPALASKAAPSASTSSMPASAATGQDGAGSAAKVVGPIVVATSAARGLPGAATTTVAPRSAAVASAWRSAPVRSSVTTRALSTAAVAPSLSDAAGLPGWAPS